MGYIGIVDYGAGNLMSVSNSLNFLGLENKIVTTPELMEGASGIILPGVGAFPDAMQALEESGLTASLIQAAKTKPFLGICLGAQMLFEESDEIRPTKGLGLLPGRVQKIETGSQAAADWLEQPAVSQAGSAADGRAGRRLRVLRTYV